MSSAPEAPRATSGPLPAEGNRPGEECVEPVAKAGRNGEHHPGEKGAETREKPIPGQPNPDEADEVGDRDELRTPTPASDSQPLALPTSKPAERGGPLAVTYTHYINEPLQPGMTAKDQIKLIEARSKVLNKNMIVGGLLPIVGILLLSGFMVVVYLLAPQVPVERMVGSATVVVLVYLAGRFVHNRWGRRGR